MLMTTTYTGYALPPTRAIFKRRNPTPALVTRSILASVFVLSGLSPALAGECTANDAGLAASQVFASAPNLAHQSDTLKTVVIRFRANVKAA
jgi:hypothetical protein